MYATIVAGFAPRKHYHNHIIEHSLPTVSFPSSMISPPQRTTVHHRYHTSHTRRPTSLHVSWFDKFHLPYGVNTTTNDNDDVELLDALLPQLPTPEDKRRVMEGFQQARLSEQLRLSKNKKGINEEPKFLADDENTVSRMADLFQQARLSEQLRLSKIKGVYPSEDDVMNIEDDMMSDEEYDKVEMFQRALLEEQLKIRRLQRQKRQEQHRLVVSSSESIEKAMNEYEVEKEMHQMATMVHENETFDENEIGDDTNGDDDIDAASIILSNLSTNDGINNDGNSKASAGELLSVNETEPSHQLDIQLAKLHQMIAFATSPSGLDNSAATQSDTTSNTSVSLQTFLSTTYLPLHPREDASVLSLALAPMAHLLSSVFLFGSAVFYSVMSVLDMIMNDTNTRACLKETGSVMKSCFGYAFPQSKMKVQEGVAKRTIKAFQISLVASFYALQGVFVRAARQSKYRLDCGNSVTGALRYLVYALRSVKVIWNRVTNNVKRSCQESKVQSKPSLTSPTDASGKHNMKKRIHRVYSGIKEKFSGQKSGMGYQQDMQPDEFYEQKLRLNQDRIVLERDKLQLQEAQRRLELEKSKLLADGLNVMAWYAAVEDKIGKNDGKKKRWWRRS